MPDYSALGFASVPYTADVSQGLNRSQDQILAGLRELAARQEQERQMRLDMEAANNPLVRSAMEALLAPARQENAAPDMGVLGRATGMGQAVGILGPTVGIPTGAPGPTPPYAGWMPPLLLEAPAQPQPAFQAQPRPQGYSTEAAMLGQPQPTPRQGIPQMRTQGQMTPQAAALYLKMAPYIAQVRTAQEQAAAGITKTNTQVGGRLTAEQLKGAVKLLDFANERMLKVMDGEQKMNELRARLRAKSGGMGKDQIELLRKLAVDADNAVEAARSLLATYDGAGSWSADPNSLEFKHYMNAKQVMQRAEVYKQDRYDLLNKAIANRPGITNPPAPGTPSRSVDVSIGAITMEPTDKDLEKMTPDQLRAYLAK